MITTFLCSPIVKWRPLLSALVAALCLSLAGCATRPAGPGTYSFALIGDVQYNEAEEALFPHLLAAIDLEDIRFVVHVGDIKAGANVPCTDALYQKRRDEFNRSLHPFVFTPGDNDWVDCRRPTNGAMDPLESLNRMRSIFYQSSESLGQRKIMLTSQADASIGDPVLSRYRENTLWVSGGVVYATVNVQGSNDNVGFDSKSDAEQHDRERANVEWLKIAVNRARGTDILGLAIFMQANPGFEEPVAEVAKSAYVPFLRAFESLATSLAKPVLFAHGDTHTYRVDKPYLSPVDKKPVPNVVRVEGYGSPDVNWVRITVDPNNKSDPFYIESGRFAPPQMD
jgi:hypothetical protein